MYLILDSTFVIDHLRGDPGARTGGIGCSRRVTSLS